MAISNWRMQTTAQSCNRWLQLAQYCMGLWAEWLQWRPRGSMGDASNFSLINDAQLPKSFDSARWKRGYNPDVAFVSTRIASMCLWGVLDPIPRTQHCPIKITIRSPVTATHCPFRRHFNVKKANLSKFTNEIYQAIANIPAHPNHYNDCVDLLKKAARHNILSGCQKE